PPRLVNEPKAFRTVRTASRRRAPWRGLRAERFRSLLGSPSHYFMAPDANLLVLSIPPCARVRTERKLAIESVHINLARDQFIIILTSVTTWRRSSPPSFSGVDNATIGRYALSGDPL